MKKKLVSVLLSAAMVSTLLAGCGGSSEEASGDSGAASGEKQNVSLTLWGAEEDQALLQSLIDSFQEEYADAANFDISLGVESESTAKDTVLTDAEAAAISSTMIQVFFLRKMWRHGIPFWQQRMRLARRLQ